MEKIDESKEAAKKRLDTASTYYGEFMKIVI